MEQSTREKALEYWNSGRMKLCRYDSAEKYFKGRDSNTLTGREIEFIYISEMAEKGKIVEKLYTEKEVIKLLTNLQLNYIGGRDKAGLEKF